MNNLETRKQYYFDREVFCNTFTKYMCLDDLYDCFGCRIYELGNFLFVRESDEYYIIDTDSLIVINWYKHLGRCNRVSKDITIEEFETFCERIGLELKGE